MALPNQPGPHNRGNLYFCVKTDLSNSGDIYLWADHVNLDQRGCLSFYGGEKGELNMAFAAGSWQAVYAASLMDDSPVAVQDWPGLTSA